MVGKRRPIASCNQTLSGFPGAQGESREERGQCGLGKSNLSLICARCLLSVSSLPYNLFFLSLPFFLAFSFFTEA